MKAIKLFHIILGSIPFAWLISFLLMLIIGTIHFGYIPRYGNIVDPYSLGLGWINIIEVALFFLSFLSFFLWPIFSAILFFNKEALSKISIIMYLVGVSSFFIFKYIFTSAFEWVMD